MEDGPPPLDDLSDVVTSGRRRNDAGVSHVPPVPVMEARSTVVGVEAVPDAAIADLQQQMIDAAIGKPTKAPVTKAADPIKGSESGAPKAAGFKKGFLLSGGSAPPKDKSSVAVAAKPSTSAASPSSEHIPFIAPQAAGAGNRLVIPEVHAALKQGKGAMEHLLSDKSWMTKELMEAIAKDPTLIAGMANPKFMTALSEMQKSPKGVMEKYKDDLPLQEFLRKFMGHLGEHFTKLGEKHQAAFSSVTASASAGAPAPSPIGLTEVSTTATSRTAVKATASASASASAPPSTKEVVASVKSGRVRTDDDDVREIMSNPVLVEILRDPAMQRVMEECRRDGSKLKFYMGIPEIKFKLGLLQKAGLIRIDI